jgi:putative transposase
MGTSSFEQGAIVHIDGREHRLDRKITDTCWQLEELKTRLVIQREHNDLLRMFADKTLTFPGSVPVSRCGPANSLLSPQDDEVAKLRRVYVLGVLGVPNTRERMEPAINDVWKRVKMPEKPPSWVSVYRWKKVYIQGKEDYRALVDNTRSKGNRTSRYPSVVIDFCNEAITAKFLRREFSSKQGTFEDALLRVMNENAQRPECDALPLPTRRIVDRLIANIPAYDRYVAQKGHDAARKAFRSVKGSFVSNSPLEWAEIDHTRLDLFVVDDETSLPMGRPYVTACIDRYTRCILGIYVGFTPAGYQSVALCLKDCFLPKLNFRDEYPEIRSEWPAYGLPRGITFDNGMEFHSQSLEQLCLSMNVIPQYAPRRQAWFKGQIERFFRSLNEDFAHVAPGTSFSNIFDKGDYDPAKHAVMRLSTLKVGIRKWIADIYHQKPHSALETTPAKMWTSSIRPEDIRLPDESIQLDAVMGLVERRVLTHKGIEYEGLFYNSSDLRDLRIREGANLDVEIRVDQSNIGSIYVLWPKTNSTYCVPALDIEYANGISLWQHEQFKKQQKRTNPPDQNPYGWLKAKEEISRMIDDDLGLKRRRTRARAARHKEDSLRANGESHSLKVTSKRLEAPISISAKDNLWRSGQSVDAESQEQAPITVRPLHSNRPKLHVTYKDGDANE